MTRHSVNNNTRTGLVISLFKFKSFGQFNTPQTASNFRHLLSCGTIELYLKENVIDIITLNETFLNKS